MGVAATSGFVSTKRLLTGMLHLSATEAGTWVAHAAQLASRRVMSGEPLAPQLPNTAGALAAGEIGPAQVRVIVDVIAHNLDLSASSPTFHLECATPTTTFTWNWTQRPSLPTTTRHVVRDAAAHDIPWNQSSRHMRWWKVLGLAGAAGVAATGVVIVRAERQRRSYTPEQIRTRLHDRVVQVAASEPIPASSPRWSQACSSGFRGGRSCGVIRRPS
ncbi:MAG: DUF222 domain-containing protein [Pseudonocardiaceae bacterium]